MKAVVKEKPAPGVTLTKHEKPAPGKDEVLAEIARTSICGTDLHIYEWDDWAANRVKPPLVVGHECAAKVVEVGENATSVAVGDKVSAETHIADYTCFQCRTGNYHVCENVKIFGVDTNGVWADYALIPSFNAWKNSADLSPEVATIQEPIGNAMHTVFTGGNVAGARVLVAGCGPIGLFAIAIAQAAGATRVYASDVNDYRLNLAEKMGADAVFNAKDTNIPEEVHKATGGRGVDAAFEISGAPAGLQDCLKAVRIGGRVPVLGVYGKPIELEFSETIVFKAAKVYGVNGRHMFETWYKVRDFIENKLIDPKKVITHHFDLKDVEKGLELMKTGNCGKVVLKP